MQRSNQTKYWGGVGGWGGGRIGLNPTENEAREDNQTQKPFDKWTMDYFVYNMSKAQYFTNKKHAWKKDIGEK